MFNRAQVIDAEGRYVTGYDKIHLFRLMDEHRFLARGRETRLFSFSGMRCALAICYDIRFCELIRKLAVAGAEALFVSAEWPMVRRDHWETLLRARAIENQMYVVACNRCGGEDGERFAGNSMIVAPDGEVLPAQETAKRSLRRNWMRNASAACGRAFPCFSTESPSSTERRVENISAARRRRGSQVLRWPAPRACFVSGGLSAALAATATFADCRKTTRGKQKAPSFGKALFVQVRDARVALRSGNARRDAEIRF